MCGLQEAEWSPWLCWKATSREAGRGGQVWAGGQCTHPCEDGEEGEGDGGPGRICPFIHWIVLRLGDLPLVGQVAEAHEPEEGPEGWGFHQGRQSHRWGEGKGRKQGGSRVHLPCSPTLRGRGKGCRQEAGKVG